MLSYSYDVVNIGVFRLVVLLLPFPILPRTLCSKVTKIVKLNNLFHVWNLHLYTNKRIHNKLLTRNTFVFLVFTKRSFSRKRFKILRIFFPFKNQQTLYMKYWLIQGHTYWLIRFFVVFNSNLFLSLWQPLLKVFLCFK